MEILALKLLVTEDNLNGLVKRFAPGQSPIEDLRLRLTPDGVVVEGDYRALVVRLKFQTLWEVTAHGAEVRARLASIKVAGLSAGMLRGLLLKVIADVSAEQPGVRVEDETLWVNVEQTLLGQGVPVKLNLTALRCSVGALVIEAGTRA
jgi:hypothetical protein